MGHSEYELTRRKFIKGIAASLGLILLGKTISGCKEEEDCLRDYLPNDSVLEHGTPLERLDYYMKLGAAPFLYNFEEWKCLSNDKYVKALENIGSIASIVPDYVFANISTKAKVLSNVMRSVNAAINMFNVGMFDAKLQEFMIPLKFDYSTYYDEAIEKLGIGNAYKSFLYSSLRLIQKQVKKAIETSEKREEMDKLREMLDAFRWLVTQSSFQPYGENLIDSGPLFGLKAYISNIERGIEKSDGYISGMDLINYLEYIIRVGDGMQAYMRRLDSQEKGSIGELIDKYVGLMEGKLGEEVINEVVPIDFAKQGSFLSDYYESFREFIKLFGDYFDYEFDREKAICSKLNVLRGFDIFSENLGFRTGDEVILETDKKDMFLVEIPLEIGKKTDKIPEGYTEEEYERKIKEAEVLMGNLLIGSVSGDNYRILEFVPEETMRMIKTGEELPNFEGIRFELKPLGRC